MEILILKASELDWLLPEIVNTELTKSSFHGLCEERKKYDKMPENIDEIITNNFKSLKSYSFLPFIRVEYNHNNKNNIEEIFDLFSFIDVCDEYQDSLLIPHSKKNAATRLIIDILTYLAKKITDNSEDIIKPDSLENYFKKDSCYFAKLARYIVKTGKGHSNYDLEHLKYWEEYGLFTMLLSRLERAQMLREDVAIMLYPRQANVFRMRKNDLDEMLKNDMNSFKQEVERCRLINEVLHKFQLYESKKVFEKVHQDKGGKLFPLSSKITSIEIENTKQAENYLYDFFLEYPINFDLCGFVTYGPDILYASALPEFKLYLEYLFNYKHFDEFMELIKFSRNAKGYAKIHKKLKPVFKEIAGWDENHWPEDKNDPSLLIILETGK
jgi:hypothetical protein